MKNYYISILLVCLLFLLSFTTLTSCTDENSNNSEKEKQLYFERGMKQIELGNLQTGIIEFKTAIQIDQKFAEARYQLALAQLKLGDAPNAMKELVRVLDVAPDNQQARIKLAELFFLAKDYQGSQALTAKILADYPGNIDALALQAKLQLTAGDSGAASETVRQAISLQRDNPRLYLIQAEIAAYQGDSKKEKEALAISINLDPGNFDFHVNYISFLMRQRKEKEAIAYLQELINHYPDQLVLYIRLAGIYETIRQFDKAETIFKDLILKDEGNYSSYIMLADFYRRHQHYNEADEAYLLAYTVNQNPLVAIDIKFQRASLLVEAGKTALAEKEINEILIEQPKHTKTNLLKARILSNQNKHREAIAILDPLLKEAPKWGEAAYYKAVSHLGVGEINLAEQAAKLAQQNANKDERPQTLLSYIYLKKGDAMAAEEQAAEALQKNVNNFSAAMTLGDALLAQGKHDSALNHFKQVAEYFPDTAETYYSIGLTYMARNQPASAQESFEQVLAKLPGHSQALNNLSRIIISNKGRTAAIDRVKKQLSVDPENSGHLLLLGKLLADDNKAEEALQVFRTAQRVSPFSLEANKYAADILTKLGRHQEVVDEYQAILQKDPNQPAIYLRFAALKEAAGDFSGARSTYREALKYEPRFAAAANNLAWLIIQEENGDLGDALRLAMIAHEADPNNPSIEDTLGVVHYKRGAFQLAFTLLQSAIMAQPQNPTIRFHYAQNLRALGKFEEANAELKKCLDAGTDFPERHQAINLLSAGK